MKILYLFIVIVAGLTACNGQSFPSKSTITGNLVKDVNNLLPEGVITVDIMDGVKQNSRQKELTLKFQHGIKENYEWFIEYIKTTPEGKPMKYHSNLGVTKDEFIELQNYLDNVELVSSGVFYVKIKKQDDIIHFKSGGKLSLLDSVEINLKTNIVTIGKYQLSFADTLNITDDKNTFKSKWKGYQWILDEPQNLDVNALKDLQTLKARQYKFTIGLLEKTQQIYMAVKGREFENGEQKVNFEFPILFKLPSK